MQQRLVFVGKDAGKAFALRDLMRGGGMKAPILVFVSSSERAKQLHRWGSSSACCAALMVLAPEPGEDACSMPSRV